MFTDVLAELRYKDWAFEVGPSEQWLRVRFKEGAEEWTGRKWLLSVHMCKSEVVQTALKAVLAAEEHEAREKFFYRGRAIFGPHYDVDSLVYMIDQGAQKARPDERG